jgi:enhanced entry protein EnhC
MKSIAIGFSILSCAYAGMVLSESAQDAYRLGNYAVAGLELKNSDPVNQYYLGKLRLYGYGLLKSNPLALQYFVAAANKGYLPAEQLLGRYALMAQNNPNVALTWFKKAASQGDNEARMYCAAAYLFGYGTAKNPDVARKYYIDAAKDGVPFAQYTLGKYFMESRDKQSKQLGIIWLTKAANLGNAQAQDTLGIIEQFGLSGEKDLPMAKTWFEKAAAQGLQHAMIHLGLLALSEHEYENARTWLLKANQTKSVPALLGLAQLYLTPNTPMTNLNEGFSLTLKAATENSEHFIEAATQLVKLYDEGIGTPQSKALAELWKKKIEVVQKSKLPVQVKTVVNWLTEGQSDELKHSPYALKGIFFDWSNKDAKQNNHYNQAPEMPQISKADLFKPQFQMIQPNEIALSDYFENIANYSSSSSPTIQDFPQYLLYPTFELLKYHDSMVLNHNHDADFIFPDTLLDQSDADPEIMVLLELVPKDQNRRLNYQRALLDLYNRAILGESAAQFELGQLYQAGVGVAKNSAQAINYYQLAAMQQEIRAEYNLGLLYLSGQTDPVDYKKGLEWLLDAAFKGNANAQYALGNLYKQGLNDANNQVLVEPNLDQAIAMYYLASSNEFAPAQFQLATTLLKQNQSNLNVQARAHRGKFIKQLYQDASQQGVADALLPLAFYQAMSKSPEEHQLAFDTASQQAKTGSSTAALLLGMLYDRGIGTSVNHSDAIRWYEQAIHNPVASFILGSYASQGVERTQHDKNAKELLTFAADQNLAIANYNLAILNHEQHEPFLPYLIKAQQEGNATAGLLLADYYLNEAQGEENFAQARSIYTDFAKKGDAVAATKLAYLADHGIGMAPNPQEAEKWYHVAASQNQPIAQYLLAELYQSGRVDGEANLLEAKKWYRASIKHGNQNASIALGFIEDTYDENYSEAMNAYKQAGASQPVALYNLALIKEYGKGEPVDYNQAFTLYQQAASLGHAGAMAQLGHLYLTGLGTSKNPNLAQEWLEKAAKLQNRQALYQLGVMSHDGVNQSPNFPQAVQYFEQAAKLGQEQALMDLANMVKTGQGCPKDEARAIELYTQAANNHNSDAAIELARIAIQQGKNQLAYKWIEQARQAGHPQAEALSSLLKNATQPKTPAVPTATAVPGKVKVAG